ncbi:uncharacterized protein LOC115746544 [Rhodamnia argentea]|uniref:Uncharacterized protein LOC115746544 n=1 Tax=Rhodamnia argentea TaxID=178133 RepID=A0A8B8PVC8_9MYRT|nr:uncharacterized protein LOC115746544 [Rhodamnia argentea]
MSGSVPLFLLWSCLFAAHACNARRFSPNGGRNPSNPVHRLGKDVEIRNLRHGKENSAEIIMERIHHEELKDLMGHLRKQQVIGGVNSGQEGSVAVPFKSHQHNADAKLEAHSISKARLMMEFANSNHNEQAIDSGELDDAKGDVMVMDYAQPHRKPPIHNEEP